MNELERGTTGSGEEVRGEEVLRFVGVAIATAAADGEITAEERRIIDAICEQAGLDEHQRRRVEAMLAAPPDEAQIARWTGRDEDRVAVYAIGLYVARSDHKLRLQEARVLDRLRRFLGLTPDEVLRAQHRADQAVF